MQVFETAANEAACRSDRIASDAKPNESPPYPRQFPTLPIEEPYILLRVLTEAVVKAI